MTNASGGEPDPEAAKQPGVPPGRQPAEHQPAEHQPTGQQPTGEPPPGPGQLPGVTAGQPGMTSLPPGPTPGKPGMASGHPADAEPDPRFTMANQRTFLAWSRTALALVAAGLGIVQLLPPFRGVPVGRHVIGIPLILLGATIAIAAYWEMTRNQLAMRRGEPLPRSVLPRLVAAAVGVVALAAAVIVLLSAAR